MDSQIREWFPCITRCNTDTLIPHVSYLALAGIIAAGTKGVLDQTNLTLKDLSTQAAAEMSPEERAAFGVKDRMSLNGGEARQRFKDDTVLRELLGSEFVDAYLNVNKVS